MQLIKIHNSLDSSTPYERILGNPKNGAAGNYFYLKMISNLLHSKFQKMAEKCYFKVFRDLFLFEVHIQQRLYLKRGNSSSCVIRQKKTEHLKIIRKSIMAVQKCKKYIAAGCIKGFLIICSPKAKKLKFVKTLISLGSY